MFNLALALALAKRGFHVFPLYKAPPGSDRPWIEPRGWQRFRDGLPTDGRVEAESGEIGATTDEHSIASWSKIANVVGYGVCSPFHIVVDLDVKNGKNGVAEFQKLKQKFGIPNPTMVVRTKSGGMHLYYDREGDFTTAKVAKATDLRVGGVEYKGVDLIANSGYVVGPDREGDNADWTPGQYLLVKGNPMDPHYSFSACPIEFYRGQIRSGMDSRLQAKPTTADELITNSWANEDDELAATIRAGKVPEKIPTGKRDSLLTSFIGVLKSRRLPKDTARILCERFLENCELSAGETRESFVRSIGLDGKLSRFYAAQGDGNDPRVVARELVEVGKVFKLVDQLHGAMAIIAMDDNPYLTPKVIYPETKARQDLLPYAKPIPESESKKPINPFDLIMRDATIPRVHSVGYKPVPVLTFTDAADGLERVNMYVPPMIPLGCSRRSVLVERFKELVGVVCGDMSEYYLDFMAHLVQKPQSKMGQAMLIISRVHGSGKNTIVQVMKPLLGAKNYLPLSGLGPLVEDKSVILEGNVLVVFNEVHRPSNRNAWTDMSKAINKVKTAITESSTQINPKYEKQRTITTFSNFVMLSNDPAPFDLDFGDRRIAVINNDPPLMDQDKFAIVADFAHNEKNGRLSPREYEDMVYEMHEFFSARKIEHNLTTGSAPMSRAKGAMIGALQSPMVQALQEYRLSQGAGCTGALTCEDKLYFVLRNVLGFRDFGKSRDRYDIWEQFISAGLIRRVYWPGSNNRPKVLTGLPKMSDLEMYPLMGVPQPSASPQRVFSWVDAEQVFDGMSAAVMRELIWSDVRALMEGQGKPGADILAMVK